MKITKNLMIATLVAGLAFAAPNANAACEGLAFAGKNNSHEYCQSNGKMNWWSAFSWCEAQGRRLATIYEVCPDWDGSISKTNNCENMSTTYNNENWTSTAYGTTEAIYTNYKTTGTAERTTLWFALCY